MGYSYTIKLDNERHFAAVCLFEPGLLIPLDIIESLSCDDLKTIKKWMKKDGEGLFAVAEITPFCDDEDKYSMFEHIDQFGKTDEMLKAKSSIYASETLKEVIEAVLAGNGNPYINPIKKENGKILKPGYIYLLHASNGLYKIGKAKNVDDRLARFEVKLPLEIALIYSIQVSDMNKAEKTLHNKFIDKRKNGEWFDLSNDDVSYICSIKEGDL